MFYKHNFYFTREITCKNFCFLSDLSRPERDLLEKKRMGSKFFPFRVDPFSEGR